MVISLPPDAAPGTGRQQHHLPGMPFGTRGGFVVKHNFPADGEYELTIGDMALAREVPRMEFENTVVVLLDGKEFYRTNIGGEADHKAIDTAARSGRRGDQQPVAQDPLQRDGRSARSGRHVRAPQLRRKRRAHAHDRARRRPGAHPGGACAADSRAVDGHRRRRFAEPQEDLRLQADRKLREIAGVRRRSSRSSPSARSAVPSTDEDLEPD